MRFSRLIACVVMAYAILAALAPSGAAAHPLSTTAILLEAGPQTVTGSVQLPIDRLEIALNEPLTAAGVVEPAKLGELRDYVSGHISASSSDGSWNVTLTGGRVEPVDGADHLVFDLDLDPGDGAIGDFTLTYDAILHQIVSHQVFVAMRSSGDEAYTTVGVLNWQRHSITVPVSGAATTGSGFAAALRLGVAHIAEGADHLLFLIMLLLPAPLLARRGRWVPGSDLRRSCLRVVHVVTAFAIGHSVTLALAALGYISLPTRLVESLIALSVLVSGVHALRPLVRGGEAWIAAGFGLMHGLAFAALIGDLGLGRSNLVADLLGFNLGIEITQLLVVALLMPSLLLISRTRAYPACRIVLAGTGIVLAAAWLAERTTLISGNPLEPVTQQLVEHPLAVAATFAVVAVAASRFGPPAPDQKTPGQREVAQREEARAGTS
ncbi:HupE/UreJ family protein [Actinoplanes sp. CA-015351]|uniref:HupE/UreJ family protein n=1 Tax=Actinoplanes sp. CA-015351 TaxID=3239897 RepID=UPI003D9627D3